MEQSGGLGPILAFALVGMLGVGSQWMAWRLRLPAIVLMLLAGMLVGPATGFFDPARDIGPLVEPMISLAVAVILFEGGLSLNLHELRDAAHGVRRLIAVGAPLGWLLSALALHFGAGLSWASSAVFGGVLIVTGPTVIAPLLRQARLPRRPAALLQWEAIVNDPLGALAAVLAFETVRVFSGGSGGLWVALGNSVFGFAVALAVGYLAGRIIAWFFRNGWIPEYMKVPILFASVLAVFAVTDTFRHESGLLAVTIMGLVIANANLPSFEELRRFKEYATILLVSGVFILLTAQMEFSALGTLDWRSIVGVIVVVLVARPLTVMAALLGTDVPWKERWLVALTGPRGVVLVAVAGLFSERLVSAGVMDGALVAPLAFAFVIITVVACGFGFAPLARLLGLSGQEPPGLLIVGGSRLARVLAETMAKAEIPVLVADENPARLRRLRADGIPVFFGDILSQAAENSIELARYGTLIAATPNEAYNTLITSNFVHEFGRNQIWTVGREGAEKSRNALPMALTAQTLGSGQTLAQIELALQNGWTVQLSRLTAEFTYAAWNKTNPDAIEFGRLSPQRELMLLSTDQKNTEENLPQETRILALLPPQAVEARAAERQARRATPPER
ncbi:MAG: cation:proton antiporter [Pseudorhodobacter sp.]